MRRAGGVGGVIALGALLLSGCAAAEPELPPRPEGAALERALEEAHVSNWRWIDQQFPGVERPTVELEEILVGVPWEEATRDCYAQFGFDVTIDQGNAYFSETTDSHEGRLAESLAYFECSGRYPAPATAQYAMTAEELGFLHDYAKNVQAPCVRAAGYEVDPLPERDDYLRMEHHWWVYDGIFREARFSTYGPDEILFNNLLLRCPELPPGWLER